MRHLVVVNPKSFRKEADMADIVRDIGAYFSGHGSEYLVHISRYPRDAIRVVSKYVGGTDETVRVYSVGGDGILYDCLNGLVNFPNAQLAVMPYGSSNDFVRAFGEGRQHLFRDIEKQATAQTIATDIINLGGRCAINFCSIGIEAAVIHRSRKIGRKHPFIAKILGKNIYVAGIPHVFFDAKISRLKYEVLIDRNRYESGCLGINLANGPVYCGKTFSPMSNPADAGMEVMAICGSAESCLFAMAGSRSTVRNGKNRKVFKHIQAREVSVRCEEPMHIVADGESFFCCQLTAKLIPAAVNIVAPGGIPYARRQKDGGQR